MYFQFGNITFCPLERFLHCSYGKPQKSHGSHLNRQFWQCRLGISSVCTGRCGSLVGHSRTPLFSYHFCSHNKIAFYKIISSHFTFWRNQTSTTKLVGLFLKRDFTLITWQQFRLGKHFAVVHQGTGSSQSHQGKISPSCHQDSASLRKDNTFQDV